MLYSDFTIIIPTLNEAGNLPTLLAQLLLLYPSAQILVVDDVSKDGTHEVVNNFEQQNPGVVKLLVRHNAEARGITASVMDGILLTNTKYFSVIDGDLQHPPTVLKLLFEKLLAGQDLVAGARLPYVEKQGFHRIFATKVSTWAAKLILYLRGLKIADPMSGVFAAKTDLVTPLVRNHSKRFEPCGYKVLFDILRIIPTPVSVDNVFYSFAVRESGHSKLRLAHAIYFMRSLFK